MPGLASPSACLLQLIICGTLSAAGCASNGTPPVESQLHIESVAGWYQRYRAENGGKAPPDDRAFAAFIQSRLAQSGQSSNIQELLTSPRDGQRYVINSKPNSSSLHLNVAVYERDGVDGKKWLAFENKWSEEVDDAKLEEYLSRK